MSLALAVEGFSGVWALSPAGKDIVRGSCKDL